jgi:hypothetical protein
VAKVELRPVVLAQRFGIDADHPGDAKLGNTVSDHRLDQMAQGRAGW